MLYISTSTKDKIQNLFNGFLYTSIASKPLFIYTATRHFLRYVFGLNLRPKELKLSMKGHNIYFKEFSGEIGMFHQIFIRNIYRLYPGFYKCENPEGTIIDVGANVGMFTIDVASANPGCKIYCMEPNPDVFTRLEKNIKANGLLNVKAFNLGISDKASVGFLSDTNSTVLGTISLEKSSGTHTVQLCSLDQFVAENNIGKIDILKIDAEGFEYLALRGLEKNLRGVGRIVMEWGADTHEDIAEYLDSVNFKKVYAVKGYPVVYFLNTKPQ